MAYGVKDPIRSPQIPRDPAAEVVHTLHTGPSLGRACFGGMVGWLSQVDINFEHNVKSCGPSQLTSQVVVRGCICVAMSPVVQAGDGKDGAARASKARAELEPES